MRRLWLQLVAAAVFLLALLQESSLAPKHDSETFLIDPPTPYTRYLPANTPKATVLAIHGLDVSREVMSFISAALADGGFEVYAIDLPGHGASKVKFDAALAEQAIRNVAQKLGEHTIVLGHSLGAGLLLDLAANQHFSTMVILSPPPMAIDEIRADRVLIAAGDIDIPRIQSFVSIAADIGAPHVEAWTLPLGPHSAAILNPVYIRRIVEWLGGEAGSRRTLARMAWFAVMFIAGLVFGIQLLLSAGVAQSASPAGRAQPPFLCEEGNVLVLYVAACGTSLIILKLGNPLGWLRLFGTDYLIGFVFLTGLFLSGAALYARPGAGMDRPYSFDRKALFKSAAAAIYVIIILGLVVTSHVLHMSLSGSRWWRFPAIVAAGFPFFAADEWILRSLHPRWMRLGVALLTRGLLLAFVLTGVLILNRESAFLVLIAPLITLFWIGLWFAAGFVHKALRDPFAAALFSALVQGWAFAAWFVIL